MTAQINTVFDPPLLTDAPETFDAKAQDMGTKLNPWAGEANTLATEVNSNALAAGQAKTDAQTAANTATIQAGLAASAVAAAATTWVSGDSYTVNELVWLTGTSGALYRCIQTHSGRSTPPDSDTDYWANTAAESALSSKLTGLSLADASAVTATDTVLQAVGKLQAGKASTDAIQLINLLPDSGRFDTSLPQSRNINDAPDIVFSPGGLFESYNGSTISEAARSYYDSSTYGGGNSATPQTVQDLFTAAGMPGRYQTQFRVLGVTFGAGTGMSGPVVDGTQLYLGSINFLAWPRRMTVGMWVRAYVKPLSILATVIRPADGWVAVSGFVSTSYGYLSTTPELYGQSGGSCEIAMPWMVAGHVTSQPDFQLLAAPINPLVFDVPTSTVTSAAYTLQLSDRGNCVDVGHDITVPKLATVAFPKGSVINLQNVTASDHTITAESGATVRLAGDASATGPYTLKAYGWVVLRKIDTASTWAISGAGI